MITTTNRPVKNSMLVMFLLAVLLALGIGYRFNTEMTNHDSTGHPLETFNIR